MIPVPLFGTQRAVANAARDRIVFATGEPYSRSIVKLPDVYKDWRIMAGLMLAFVGAGNWVVGLNKTRVASQMIAQASHTSAGSDYRSFDEVDSTAGVLKPFTEEEARVSYATARMDFYHVTFLTGQVLVIVGLIVTLIGFINVIQRDTRRSIRRLSDDVPLRIRERNG
jgi:hypothetical protein